MNTYGDTFKHLREAKGISLTEASKNIVSKSFLSRFERGKSNIVFDKLYFLLLNINVSVDEFVYLDNHINQRYQPFHYDDTKDYVDEQSVDSSIKLRDYYYQQWQTNHEQYYYVNFLKEKATLEKHQLSELTLVEKHFLYDYLFSKETWTHYEIRLYMSIITLFEPLQSYYLTEQMIKKGSDTVDVNWNHQADLLYVILTTALTMANTNHVIELSNMITEAHTLIHNEQYLYEKTELHFIEGLLLYLQKNYEPAQKKVQESLYIFEILNSKNLAKLYQQRWQQFIDNYNHF